MHIETDCPFLPPQGKRGERNEPAWMDRLLTTIADARGVTAEDVDRLTTANTRRLFHL
ncbi:MAG: TatD family hydrolase [Phycisphaerales bacterium]|nr:TatD family hydrolase [Phycisphaerales bacterium]